MHTTKTRVCRRPLLPVLLLPVLCFVNLLLSSLSSLESTTAAAAATDVSVRSADFALPPQFIRSCRASPRAALDTDIHGHGFRSGKGRRWWVNERASQGRGQAGCRLAAAPPPAPGCTKTWTFVLRRQSQTARLKTIASRLPRPRSSLPPSCRSLLSLSLPLSRPSQLLLLYMIQQPPDSAWTS